MKHTRAGRELVKTTACPKCGARPKWECRNPSGSLAAPHQARWANRPTSFPAAGLIQPRTVCDRCGRPCHQVAGATDNGQPVEIWHHDEVADDVFCGLVMHAADRLPR